MPRLLYDDKVVVITFTVGKGGCPTPHQRRHWPHNGFLGLLVSLGQGMGTEGCWSLQQYRLSTKVIEQLGH